MNAFVQIRVQKIMEELVLRETIGPVAVVTLNRPERHNSLVPDLLRALLDALATAETDEAVRAVVLQANGRSFSTGGDAKDLSIMPMTSKCIRGRLSGCSTG